MTGIDVSEHQSVINWDMLKPHIQFAIIRLGYGKGVRDKYGLANIAACERLQIPYGVYWFSYAMSAEEAEAEAAYCLNILGEHRPALPIYYDFEYASESRYKSVMGKPYNRAYLPGYANRFCKYIETRGYRAGIYTNPDMLPAFKDSTKDRSLWLAAWSNVRPAINCDIWQKSSESKFPGITGRVDENVIINEEVLQMSVTRWQTIEEVPNAYRSKVQQYIDSGIIAGKETGLDLTEDMVRGLIYAERLFTGGLKV